MRFSWDLDFGARVTRGFPRSRSSEFLPFRAALGLGAPDWISEFLIIFLILGLRGLLSTPGAFTFHVRRQAGTEFSGFD